MVKIDISAAEQAILQVLPKARAVERNTITTKGVFLLFHSLAMDNDFIADVGYHFRLYVAINSLTKNQTLAYQPLSECLASLLTHWQQDQLVKVGRIKPNASKGLIIYEVELTYQPCIHEPE